MEKLNIKFLLRAHTIVGLFCIFLFYISSYFGSLTFFLPYINYWELPSKHIEKTLDYGFNIDNKLDFPYIFGGDGSSLIIPSSLVEKSKKV